MYYPKSQITPNLYTNGDEFAYSTTKQEYIGYYFKVSTGKYFSGKNQDDRPNIELTSIEADITTTNIATSLDSAVIVVDPIYSYITNTPVPPPTFIPLYNPVLPSNQDYKNGEFRRFFCKKTNEIQYIEINIPTYNKLIIQDPQILWQLYQPFNITWKLTGTIQEVVRTNYNIVQLASKAKNLPMLENYLNSDYIKYRK